MIQASGVVIDPIGQAVALNTPVCIPLSLYLGEHVYPDAHYQLTVTGPNGYNAIYPSVGLTTLVIEFGIEMPDKSIAPVTLPLLPAGAPYRLTVTSPVGPGYNPTWHTVTQTVYSEVPFSGSGADMGHYFTQSFSRANGLIIDLNGALIGGDPPYTFGVVDSDDRSTLVDQEVDYSPNLNGDFDAGFDDLLGDHRYYWGVVHGESIDPSSCTRPFQTTPWWNRRDGSVGSIPAEVLEPSGHGVNFPVANQIYSTKTKSPTASASSAMTLRAHAGH